MNAPRWVPPLVAGAAALVVLAGISWANDMRTPDPPDMHEREAVKQRFSQVGGIRPILPVTLPLGYDYARDYDYETVDATPESLDGTTKRSGWWSVFFFPKDGASEDGLPVVVFCVQDARVKDRICPEHADATHLQRRLGTSTATIYRASPGSRDMSAWRAVDLTTDLDKVTWLR